MGIPVQSECDLGKPDEHFLWALVNIGGDIGAPLLLPEPIMRKWSEHLFYCGFRFDPELQQRWYEQPVGDSSESFWAAPGGKWADTPPTESDEVDKMLDALSPAQQADLLTRLKERDEGAVE